MAGESKQFWIIIDAGSSGSRIHVHSYSFIDTKRAGEPPVEVFSAGVKKLRPGISSYVEEPEKVASQIQELLEFAETIVPKEHHSLTPVQLKGTGGLRSLDSDDAQAILEQCRKVIESSSFDVGRSHAQMIEGEEEAVFAWISLNHLNGNLYGHKKDTLGLLEMGGASVQICFDSDQAHSTEIEIWGKTFRLHASSFLELGIRVAQDRLSQFLIDGGQVSNPCYPLGKSFNGLDGTGSYQECYTAIDSLFGLSKTVPICMENDNAECIQKEKELLDESFVAVEYFFYVSRFFKGMQEDYSLGKLRNLGDEFCSSNWEDIMILHLSSLESEEFLEEYCFASAYISYLFEHSFGLDVILDHDLIQVDHAVDGKSIEWAIGVVILELSKTISMS